jgi:hypothetical protein
LSGKLGFLNETFRWRCCKNATNDPHPLRVRDEIGRHKGQAEET